MNRGFLLLPPLTLSPPPLLVLPVPLPVPVPLSLPPLPPHLPLPLLLLLPSFLSPTFSSFSSSSEMKNRAIIIYHHRLVMNRGSNVLNHIGPT